jgi:hypothetical protein
LAGEVIMDYYKATAKPEYLERGVEALRSQFPISPSENWAHTAYGKKAGISSFHWGTGSGMAGIEMEEDFVHDAVCDVAAKRCVGVNGLNVTDWQIEGNRLQLTVESPFQWKRKPVIVFHKSKPLDEYQLSVNGTTPQRVKGQELEKGVAIELNRAVASSAGRTAH